MTPRPDSPIVPEPVPGPDSPEASRQQLADELLPLFKAMADGSRLRIIGLLATRAHTVEQLGEALGLSPSTVSHHLSKLAAVGLVSARPESYYNVYNLDTGPFERAAREVLARTRSKPAPAALEGPAFERRVLRDNLTPEGTLRALPAQQKKRRVLLLHVLEVFETGRRYTEKQVNELLRRFSDTEYVVLRRYLIDYGMLGREGGGRDYWRPA